MPGASRGPKPTALEPVTPGASEPFPIAEHFRQLEADFRDAIAVAKNAVERFEELLVECESPKDLQARCPHYTLASLRGESFTPEGLLSDRNRTVTRFRQGKADFCGWELIPAASRLVSSAVEQRRLLRPLRLCRETVPTFRSENRLEDDDDLRAFWKEVVKTLKEEFPTQFPTAQPVDPWALPTAYCAACFLLAAMTTPLAARPAPVRKPKRGEAASEAMLVFAKNPQWSVQQVAAEIGSAHTTLYRNATFMKMFNSHRAAPPPPRGHRTRGDERNPLAGVESRSDDPED